MEKEGKALKKKKTNFIKAISNTIKEKILLIK